MPFSLLIPRRYHPLATAPIHDADRRRSPAPRSIQERLADIRPMIKFRDSHLANEIKELLEVCHATKTPFIDVLTAVDGDASLLFLLLTESQDIKVLATVHRNISNGWYPGRIQRTDEGLFLHHEDGRSRGFQRVGVCQYVGPFLKGERHGKDGFLLFSPGWYYRGDFYRNQQHGIGEDVREGADARRYSGLFLNDVFRGVPEKPYSNQSRFGVNLRKKNQ